MASGKWSAEADRHLWSVLGHHPRTAAGLLVTNPETKQLVAELATACNRTVNAIRSRMRHLDDPLHESYQRLHAGVVTSAMKRPAAATTLVTATTSRTSRKRQACGPTKSTPLGWQLLTVDDDDDVGECVVNFGTPLLGDACALRHNDLRQPPFDGNFTAGGVLPAAEHFRDAPTVAAPSRALSVHESESSCSPRLRRRSYGGDTKKITLEMMRAGRTISEVASARQLASSTIQNHIVDLYSEGLLPDAPQRVGLTQAICDEIRRINSSLTGADVGKLRPIKNRCKYDYTMIKLALTGVPDILYAD